MTKRKKKIMLFHLIFWPSLNFTLIVAFILSTLYALIFHLDDGYILRTDISEYSTHCRIGDHCNQLTLHPGEGQKGKPLFIDEYQWQYAFYRYEYIGPDYEKDVIKQITLLSLFYDEHNYNIALNDVQSQKYYSDKINFAYKTYDFNLNDSSVTGFIGYDNKFDLESETPYIEDILLVGHSDALHSIIFLGVYYAKFDNYYSIPRNKNYYYFTDWPTFFSDFFSFYNWD